MDDKIFRQKSLEKVKSPETLDDYIHVSNPGIWLLLVSVIFLLAGACVWGTLGHIDSIVEVTVQVKDGTAVCAQTADGSAAEIREGAVVKFAGAEAPVTEIRNTESGWECVLQLNDAVANGVYSGKIVTESIRPLSLILN